MLVTVEKPSITDIMKWFHCVKDDNNDDFIKMKTEIKISSHANTFVAFGKRFGWFKVKKVTVSGLSTNLYLDKWNFISNK